MGCKVLLMRTGYGTTPPQYEVTPYGKDVSLCPVTVRMMVLFEPSSFCAVAHSVSQLVFTSERVTPLEKKPLPVSLPLTWFP